MKKTNPSTMIRMMLQRLLKKFRLNWTVKKLEKKFLAKYPHVFREELEPGDVVNIPEIDINIKQNNNITPVNVKNPSEIPLHL